jgi:hypothetical protein
MLQLPALALCLLLASTYAVAFHLWQGRDLRDLLIYGLASFAGFAAGQMGGQRLDLVPWTVGEVRVVEASLIAFLFLLVARWLRPEEKKA